MTALTYRGREITCTCSGCERARTGTVTHGISLTGMLHRARPAEARKEHGTVHLNYAQLCGMSRAHRSYLSPVTADQVVSFTGRRCKRCAA